jgi:hypothetical protein
MPYSTRRLLSSFSIIRLPQKNLPGTNTPTYFSAASVTKLKNFNVTDFLSKIVNNFVSFEREQRKDHLYFKDLLKPWNSIRRGRLGTVHLLIKLAFLK